MGFNRNFLFASHIYFSRCALVFGGAHSIDRSIWAPIRERPEAGIDMSIPLQYALIGPLPSAPKKARFNSAQSSAMLKIYFRINLNESLLAQCGLHPSRDWGPLCCWRPVDLLTLFTWPEMRPLTFCDGTSRTRTVGFFG